MPHHASDIGSAVARKRRYPEASLIRFREGTIARVEAVAASDENLADVVRLALDRELERREAARERQKAKQERDR
jgi:hypothetical protein